MPVNAAKHPIRHEIALPKVAVTPLPEVLPDDVDALKALLRSQLAEQQQAARTVQEHLLRHIDYLYEQIVLLRHRQFGIKAEHLPAQSRLFDEAEALEADSTPEQDQAGIPAQSSPTQGRQAKPARGKRAPLPAELPRIDIVHDVPEAERRCACGTPMVEIGQEVSEQLDIVPMQIRVLRHIRKRYGCPGGEQAPVIAALPARVLPKSNASNDLLAMLLTLKYVDGLPLARIEHVLARSGVTVPRQTQARWIIGTARALQPLHNLMRDALLESPVLHMDETTVQVLKEPGKTPQSTSYMWVQKGGPPAKPVVLYDYDASRSGQVPVRLLEGWRGYLMTDGYDGYNAAVDKGGIEHLACMAHARRRFVEAARVQAKGKRGRADDAIEQIAALYRIERELKDASDDERYAARQQHSVPRLAALREWLDTTRAGVPPQTALGRALAYLDKYWSRLVRYTERGDLPIDNNPCEGAIRPFVTGRKAWLFADTQAGAQASALIYSLIETARANGLEPYAWLRRVLRLLPTARTADEYEALLPWNMHAMDLASEITP